MYYNFYYKKKILLIYNKNKKNINKNIYKVGPVGKRGICILNTNKLISNFNNIKKKYFIKGEVEGRNNMRKGRGAKNINIFIPYDTYIKIKDKWFNIKSKMRIYLKNEINFFTIKKKNYNRIVCFSEKRILNKIITKSIYSLFKKKILNFIKNIKILLINIDSDIFIKIKSIPLKGKILIFIFNINIKEKKYFINFFNKNKNFYSINSKKINLWKIINYFLK
ncbi:hypothetical protein [Candidatus Vidania fulgoroideorum]